MQTAEGRTTMPVADDDLTMAQPELRRCPHCQQEMLRWYTPPDSTWGTPYQYVCFNDECSYYQRGWEWMQKQYNKKASYRHRMNPYGKDSGPVPVWSPDALRARIIPEGMDYETYVVLQAKTGKGSDG